MPLQPPPFATWTAEDTKAALAGAAQRPVVGSVGALAPSVALLPGQRTALYPSTTAGMQGTPRGVVLAQIRAMLDGDHWMGGVGWGSALPPEVDTTGAPSDAREKLRDGFKFRNLLAEIQERHRDGVVGKELAWGFAPRGAPARTPDTGEDDAPADDPVADTLAAALTDWWDREGVATKLAGAIGAVLWAERIVLRLIYRPSAFANGNALSIVQGDAPSPLDAALRHIGIDVCAVGQASIYTDVASSAQVGIYAFTVPSQKPASTDVPKTRYELYWIDPTGKTMTRSQDAPTGDVAAEIGAPSSTGDSTSATTYGADFGRRLPVYELERQALLTADLVSLQKMYNLMLTVLGQREIASGFVDEYIINAQVNGRSVPIMVDGTQVGTRFEPMPVTRGPYMRQNVYGIPIKDAEGNASLTTPQVYHREPGVSDTTALDGVEDAMLKRASQMHATANQSATSSGDAQQQRRAEFVRSLRTTAGVAEPAARWILETVAAMAEAALGDPGKYTSKYRAHAQCRLDAGPVPADEQAANWAAVGTGALSETTAMAMNGIDDPDAERAQRDREPGYRQKRAADIFTALGLSVTAGVDADSALAAMQSADPYDVLKGQIEPPTAPADPNANDPNAPSDPTAPPANPAASNASDANA